jgi:hypothetical protein
METKPTSMLLSGVVALVLSYGGNAVTQQPQSPVAVLVTKRMCCAHESVPAIKEMSKIPGVARVVADHNARSLTIVPKANAIPSPMAIWEAAERTQLEPLRLSTALGVYNAKPRR